MNLTHDSARVRELQDRTAVKAGVPALFGASRGMHTHHKARLSTEAIMTKSARLHPLPAGSASKPMAVPQIPE